MDGGYKGWNPYIERFLSIVFDLERTNQLNLLPDKDLVDLCPPIEPYQVTKNHDLQVFSRKSRLSIESYKDAVRVYRNAEDKSQKREMERLISEIKGSFRQTLQGDNPQKKRLRGLETDLYSLEIVS